MPPKKKRATTNPIVVGTVSTRSTRRQSIVNIEIPKSRRAKSSGKIQKDNRLSGKTSPIILNSLHTKNIKNHIKTRFSNILNVSRNSPTETKISANKSDSSVSSKNSKCSKFKSDANLEKPRLRRNKALLEILEDWSDDESQEFKKEVPDFDNTHDSSSSSTGTDQNKYFENLEFGADDINEIIGDNFRSIHSKASNVTDVNEIELALKSEKKTERIEEISSELSTVNEIENTGDLELELGTLDPETSLSEEVVESCVIEGNEIIIDEQLDCYEDNIMVECVTEEVVPEQNEVIFQNKTTSTSNISEHNDPDLEEISSTKIQIAQEINVSTEENIEIDQALRQGIISEDTCQSVSTNDSNDAEVRSFFAKEIEKNQNVYEKNKINLDGSVGDGGCSKVRQLAPQINVFEAEVIRFRSNHADNADIETTLDLQNKSLKSILELERTLDDELKVHHSLIELERTLEDDSEEKSPIESLQKNLAEFGLNNNGNVNASQDIIDSMEKDIQDGHDANKLEESLENKIADLHLKDTLSVLHDDDINKKVAELNLETCDQSDNRICIRQKLSPQETDNKTKKTACQKIVKSSRTKSVEAKPPRIKRELKTKISKSDKTATGKKPKEVKSKLSKEPKPKKKISPLQALKKSKVKINQRESNKVEKKDKLETELDDMEIRRRSSRIQSISVLKKKTTGHGLVRSKSEPSLKEYDICGNSSLHTESEKGTPSASPKIVKERKTRWGKSVENLSLQMHTTKELENKINQGIVNKIEADEKLKIPAKDPVVEARLKTFVHLKENLYKTDRMTCKEAKKMTCDCFLTPEEIDGNEYGCGDDCLNKLLLIECGNLCQVGDRCTNKRFQKGQFAPVEVFNTEKKGLGLRAAANIPFGEFILEYVGEVLNTVEFDKRAEVYSQDKNIHYYFMALRADAIIDATMKGNISRFINHSCDPNAETQKWTVNGELRIGFFSTRTILAGEEVTFDYRFQRYGKEAQKCYCEAAICRGWLGEQPEDDSEEDEEEEEEVEEVKVVPVTALETEKPIPELTTVDIKEIVEVPVSSEVSVETLPEIKNEELKIEDKKPGPEIISTVTTPSPVITVKKKSQRKKPRVELFEEIDQLNEEIEMLLTTGLKNQAHTLKLSRLMVRSKEPQQRTKLLRVLRRGELPCRRLFLDYHGLRLIHGYMIDAQHLVITNKKYESLRLEMLQTLAVLPIPNKTMLQDSKVLPTVEMWATNKDLTSPLDSDSNSPKVELDQFQQSQEIKEKGKSGKQEDSRKDDSIPERSIEDQEEEIRFLANKLLEEWSNLKEVFRIPKKERIEQMKEHEREANKKFMQSGYGNDQDKDKKYDRYRSSNSKYKSERENSRKGSKSGDKPSAEFIRLSRIERRKLFALQHELKEEERRLKQREMWRQHEMNCMIIGTDPRFTAPFDPSRGYQCIWNPQIGQWQNYPLPPNSTLFQPTQTHTPLPNLNVPPPQISKSLSNFSYNAPITIATSLSATLPPLPTRVMPGQVQLPPPTNVPQMATIQSIPQTISGTLPPPNIPSHPPPSIPSHPPPSIPTHPPPSIPTHPPPNMSSHPLPNITTHSAPNMTAHLPPNMPTHSQIPTIPTSAVQAVQYQETKIKEDPSQVKFMGPIPPPVKLPQKWKCAKDKYGRPYYYHIKLRKSQWEPPPPPPNEPEESSETESSSDTSSLSSDSSTDNSESDDEIDDTRLLVEVRKQMERSSKPATKSVIPDYIKMEDVTAFSTPSPDEQNSEETEVNDDELSMASTSCLDEESKRPSIDIRLKEQFNLLKDDIPPRKRRRLGLCEEIIISPRTEEDRMQFKEDLKRYKANKEKLKRQKEQILQQTRKQMKEIELKKSKEKRSRTSLKVKIKEMPDFNSDAAKKIKETFRANMASTVVSSLNIYRKSDCKEGRITNTDDFKHLARKLTHFVMLKEMKHIAKIEDLTCTDNVKVKAREYIRKYMSKFGEVYIKRNDSPDFKD